MPASIFIRDGIRQLNINPNGDSVGPFLYGSDNEPERATFGATIFNFTPAATPTDVFIIKGSATRVIRVKSLTVSGISTVAGHIPLALIRRSTAPTGGTPVALTPGAHDIIDGAATAIPSYYTANPTLGTLVAILHNQRLALAPAASSTDRLAFQFSWINEKAIVLRGVNDYFCLNMAGATLPAGTAIDIDALWTEE